MTSTQDLALLRLVAQRIAGPPLPGAAEVVRWLTAMQAQDPRGAVTSVALRAASGTRQAVEAAFDAGEIVKSWPMRGTLHLVAAEDLPWLLRLTAPRVVANAAARRAQLGIDDATLERARQLAVKALAGGGRLTRAELMAAWEEGGLTTAGQRGYHLLAHLAQTGLLCFGPTRDAAGPTRDAPGPIRDAAGPTRDAAGPTRDAAGPTRDAPGPIRDAAGPTRGAGPSRDGAGPTLVGAGPIRESVAGGRGRDGEQAIVLVEEWIREPRILERDEALGELATRYFLGHGPATVKDFTRWTFLPAVDVRAGLAIARPRLASLTVDGVEYLMDPRTPELLSASRRGARGVFLLPGFDEFILGYGDRSAMVPPEFADRIVPGGNGVFQPTVVSAGRVVGVWKRGKQGVIATPFTSFSAPVAAAIDRVYAALPS